jgi:hypothetical protein
VPSLRRQSDLEANMPENQPVGIEMILAWMRWAMTKADEDAKYLAKKMKSQLEKQEDLRELQ